MPTSEEGTVDADFFVEEKKKEEKRNYKSFYAHFNRCGKC